jgi:hypothetical protein
MESSRLLPIIGAGLVLGLVIATLLIAWRRHLPPDLTGRVKADAALAMLRALLMLLAGLALLLGVNVARLPAFGDIVRWLGMGFIVIGGVGFVARVALYLLRIKPELEQLPVSVAPASPARTRQPGSRPRNHP